MSCCPNQKIAETRLTDFSQYGGHGTRFLQLNGLLQPLDNNLARRESHTLPIDVAPKNLVQSVSQNMANPLAVDAGRLGMTNWPQPIG